jgi:hypothetical protein
VDDCGHSDEQPPDFRLQALLWVCACAIGKVPTLDEFATWREARRAQSPRESLPAPAAYIEQYGSWSAAVAARDLRAAWLVESAVPTPREPPAVLSPSPVSGHNGLRKSWMRASLRHCARAIGHVPEAPEYRRWQADYNGSSRSDGRPLAPVPDQLAYIERYGDWPRALADADLAAAALVSAGSRS